MLFDINMDNYYPFPSGMSELNYSNYLDEGRGCISDYEAYNGYTTSWNP